ncbi:MAG: hypothetical protein IPP51_05310 [Bacteroidetes bacterium]|nr:hypothetical protein [Bacteroidota bacterium]
MKTISKFLIISVFALTILSGNIASAQFNTQQPFIPSIGQSIISRPSVFPKNNFYIGIPLLSNINIGVTNDGLDVLDAKLKTDTGTYIDLEKVIGGLNAQNTIAVDYSMDLLSFGFKAKKSYFSMNVSHRAPVVFRFSDNFLKLIYKGNGAFLGETIDFSKTGFSATNYWEIGLGYTRQINDKFTAGFRVRRLTGLDNFSTKINTLKATTSSDDYSLNLQSDMVINASSPFNNSDGFDSVDMVSGYLLNTQNTGWAFNAGVSYQYSPKLQFSFDALDFGSIHWKNNVKNYRLENGTYSFSGVGLGQFFGSDTTVDYVDSLGHSFPTLETKEAYTTTLPSTLILNTQYQLAKHTYASLMLRGWFFQTEFIPSGAIMLRQEIGRHISLDVNYSRQYGNYYSLGSGVDFQLGSFNFFILSDNILGTIQPLSGKSIHLNMGMSVCFVSKPKKPTSAATPVATPAAKPAGEAKPVTK